MQRLSVANPRSQAALPILVHTPSPGPRRLVSAPAAVPPSSKGGLEATDACRCPQEASRTDSGNRCDYQLVVMLADPYCFGLVRTTSWKAKCGLHGLRFPRRLAF